MTALAQARKLTSIGEEGLTRTFPVAASTVIYNGALVMLDSSGNAVPGAKGTATLVIAGVAEETVDNSAGSAGDKTVRVRGGDAFIAGFNNHGSNTIDASMVGALAYVDDDNTVASTNTGSRPKAGWVHSYDATADQVYVEIPGRAI